MMDNKIEIVLIGGDKEQYKSLEALLNRLEHSSYQLRWSASYSGGLTYAKANQPDVFLVNFDIGDFRALDFISEIRKRDCVKPVILLAQKSDYLAERKARQAGAELYLEKNFENPWFFERAILETVERAKALDAIRKSESRMRGIFYGASIGIALIDMDRHIVQGNPSLCRILGYDSEQICAMDIAEDFTSADDARQIRISFDQLIRRETIHASLECRFQSKEGPWVWIQLTLSLFAETNALPQFIIGLIEDVSEKKKAQLAQARTESQLRELSRELVKAEEKERNRIAMELHDGIGGSLAGIKYMIEKIKIQKDRSPQGYLGAIDRLESQLVEVMDEVTRISGELFPRILSDLGLLPAIRWLVKKLGAVYTDIAMDFHIQAEEPQITDEFKIIIFRLVQEALTNAAKHSDANQITVTITNITSGISVSVKDNGSGFSGDILEHSGQEKGMGLRNMVKRTELSGGTMRIESRPKAGTDIYMEWSFTNGK